VVIKDIKPEEKVTGNFAIPHFDFMRNWVRSTKRYTKQQTKS